MGHFRSDCTLPEQCLFCGDPAHLAAACKERFNSRRRREVIEYLGHGIDGGFYYIDLGGRREISPTEFAVAFPSPELLRALSWSKTTILPANNINVSVRPSCVDPDTMATLSEVWVRVHDIPEEARSEHIIELISQAIDKLVTMDPLTLPGTGPVRMLILSPDPAKLTCTLPNFFFRKGGRALVVEVEGDETQAGSPTPPLDPSQPHQEDDDAEDDDDSSDGDSEDDLGGDGEETPQEQAPGGGTGDATPGA
ncbi:hypothetical protein QYE76_041072 [Lolium multiflorum]|uniref:DUF4283 domain-containing protein n=1 Tax=Lolium multiflorum TaxID=4521 RepID=A0AAD8WTT1_LOLMU|nr:hypothetical protein QYE76_041072 [Lolium multiflorum]